MRSFSFLTLLASTFAVLGGCSFLYQLDGEQCSVDGDCDGQLTGWQCVDGLCVAPASAQGGGGGTDSGGKGGTVSGGTGGTDVVPDCYEHTDCMEQADGLPAVCREGECTTLVNGADDGECTVVLGRDNLQENREVFVFGAFSAIGDPRKPLSSPITLNFDYVINEVTKRGGLRIQGTTRYPVAVVCNAAGADSDALDISFDHLVDDVGVPAIISSLYALELKRSFERVYNDEEDGGKGKRVFFLSPFESDKVLTEVPDSGLLWHLLPDSLSVAPAYIPLFERVEAKVLASAALGGGGEGGAGGASGGGGAGGASDAPIRVALIEGDFQWLLDVSSYLRDNLTFNGGLSTTANGDNFAFVKTDSAGEMSFDAYTALRDFRPHIIVSASGVEFHQVMNDLESNWDTFAGGEPRPYYILSPFQYGPELTDLISDDLSGAPTLRERVVGINTAAAEDTDLYEEYLAEFKASYPDFEPPELLNGTENFYDAALFTLLAASGAGNVPELTGIDIALGMRRLVDTLDGTAANMTLDKLQDYANTLNTTDLSYALTGTLGPPDFKVGAGTRQGSGSVWCVNPAPQVVFDALRYDKASGTLTGDPFPCFGLPPP